MTSKLLDVRKAVVRLLVCMLYEGRYSTRNLGWIYRCYVSHLFGVSFETFSSYLDAENDPLDDVEIPTYIVVGLWALVNTPRDTDRLPEDLRRVLASASYVKTRCVRTRDAESALPLPCDEETEMNSRRSEDEKESEAVEIL